MATSGVATAGSVTGLTSAVLELYAADILFQARGVMRYEDFAVRTSDLTRVKGDTINVTKVASLSRGGALTEGVAISTKAMAQSLVPVSVTEYGNGVEVTEKLLLLSRDAELQKAATLLSRDYAVVRDLSIRDALVASGNTVFANGSALGDVGADHVMSVASLRDALENLANVNAPKFMGDYYVCFVHPHQVRGLRDDPDWIAAQNYANTRRLFNGEIGRMDDVVFIQTTHQGNGSVANTHEGYEAALVGSGADSNNLYRATLLCDQSYALADALPVEMRDGGVIDFGRMHQLAWYALWGSKALESDYIQHIITA